jgi:hypothetical protein
MKRYNTTKTLVRFKAKNIVKRSSLLYRYNACDLVVHMYLNANVLVLVTGFVNVHRYVDLDEGLRFSSMYSRSCEGTLLFLPHVMWRKNFKTGCLAAFHLVFWFHLHNEGFQTILEVELYICSYLQLAVWRAFQITRESLQYSYVHDPFKTVK